MTNQQMENRSIFGSTGKMVTPDEFAGDLVGDSPFLKIGLGGFAGSGKSTTLAEIMSGFSNYVQTEKPLLIIGTERNAAQWLEPFFIKRKVAVKYRYTRSLSDLLTAIELCEAGHYFGLHVDSLTHIYLDFVQSWIKKNHPEKASLGTVEFQWWGKIKPLWNEMFGRRFVDARTHIGFTGRGGYEYDKFEDEESGKVTQMRSGVKMQMGGDTPFDPDIVVWMQVKQKTGSGGKTQMWRESLIIKDRSSLIDGKTFRNPTFKDFKPPIELMLKTIKQGTVIQGHNGTIDLLPDPTEENPNAKRKRIVLDQIKSYLASVAPGNTKSERKQAINILQRAFSNPSWEFIKTLDVDILQQGLDQVKADCEQLQTVKGVVAA